MPFTVCFILAPGHCGSTLLDLLIGSQPGAASLGELGSLSLRTRRGALQDRICGLCEGPCPLWDDEGVHAMLAREFRGTKYTSKPARTLLGRLGGARAVYPVLRDVTAASVLVDSTKRVTWAQRQLGKRDNWSGAEPVFIVLRRDGRAVVNSFRRLNPQRSVRQVTEQWARTVETIDRFIEDEAGGAALDIRYEELATNPEATVRVVADRLGLEFRPEGLRFWEFDHHPLYGNAGTHSLIRRFRQRETQHGDEYYDSLGLGIAPDMRWVDELSAEALEQFEHAGGRLNQSLGYPAGLP